MSVSAVDVKKLRQETDAPILECRSALQEAGNDFEKAKAILREKGKAAAAKRQDRNTSAGVVALAVSDDNTVVGGVQLECETDFVARNEDFIQTANIMAKALLTHDSNDVLTAQVDGKSVQALVEEAVLKIRENIKVVQSFRSESSHKKAVYVHHDKAKAVMVEAEGDASNLLGVAYQLAIQAVAFPPEFIHKEEVPQDLVQKEIEIETQRAINDGKSEEIARNIAVGRINKEYYKRVVFLEQPFYKDPSMSVDQYVKNESKAANGNIKIVSVKRLEVGLS